MVCLTTDGAPQKVVSDLRVAIRLKSKFLAINKDYRLYMEKCHSAKLSNWIKLWILL